MQEVNLNFEEINAHVEKHFSKPIVQSSLTKANALSQLCSIYKTVRPILLALSGLPIIPGNWKKVIATLIAVLDVMCP